MAKTFEAHNNRIIIAGILKELFEYITKYKADALKDLQKNRSTLTELRGLDDDELDRILDARVEGGDFESMLADLASAVAARAAASGDDWE